MIMIITVIKITKILFLLLLTFVIVTPTQDDKNNDDGNQNNANRKIIIVMLIRFFMLSLKDTILQKTRRGLYESRLIEMIISDTLQQRTWCKPVN